MKYKKGDIIRKDAIEVSIRDWFVLEHNLSSGFSLSIADTNIADGPEETSIKDNPAFLTAEFNSDNGPGTITENIDEVMRIIERNSGTPGLKLEPIIKPRTTSEHGDRRDVEHFVGFEVIEPS